MNKTLTILTIIITMILFTTCGGKSPGKQAVNIIEKDQGRSINVLSIAYNEEKNLCIVTFTIEGRNDIAIVNLNNNIVGYKSLFMQISNPQELVDYVEDAFDPFILLNYQKSGDGWVELEK